MKKICILLSLMIMLICSGCGPTSRPLLEGTFSSNDFTFQNEDMNETFSAAKVTIKEITKEEYENAKGINVLIDGHTSQSNEKRYLSIELYLYSIETKQYELVTLYDLYFIEGTQQVFHSKTYLKINEKLYQNDTNSTCVLCLDSIGPRDISIFGIYITFKQN